MAAMAVLVAVARRLRVPYPMLLVLGGLIIGFVPGLPAVELEPDLVFLLFLPPILQAAAFFTSIRDFRANLRPILLLALGLVLFTTVAVAVVARGIIEGITWPEAFLLGAIVSPPDAVAATSIAQNVRLPRRIITVLEGESLVNDATALTAYNVAVAAALTGSFSPAGAGLEFLRAAVGGVVVGLALGWLIVQLLGRMDDTLVEITVGFLAGYLAYLLAERLHVSGVLAVVAVGLYLGRNAPVIMSPQTRLQAVGTWNVVIFLLNGLVFILIGLQLPRVLEALEGESAVTLLWYALVISVAVILIRIAWVFPATYVPRVLIRRVRERDPSPPVRNVAIVAWTGMRGVVSLAAALALPPEVPARDLILFLTFAVILATLVVQGLSLAPLVRILRVEDDGGAEREEAEARLRAVQAAMARLEQLATEEWVQTEWIEDHRRHYQERAHHLTAPETDEEHGHHGERQVAYVRLQTELLAAERDALLRLRDDGVIGDEVMRQVERELDLERVRLEA
jgi:CPA1 family monovalent cation:H+ antiporter